MVEVVAGQDEKPIPNGASPNQSQSPKISSRITDDGPQETVTAKTLNEKLVLENMSDDSSTQHDQSPQPEVVTNVRDEDMQDSVKSLSEKLAAALLTINAKEDLVKQHTKVAEEAVAGWEQAEAEVGALKRLLESSSQKNASLEDQVNHLDDALKECVRQLRQAREEEEEKIRDAVVKKTQELDSEKSELQNHISELKQQLEATKLEATSVAENQNDLQAKLHVAEKENKGLKIELLMLSKDLKRLSLERDLSNQAAETASKQHLESVKKITRVEAECRKLRHLTRRTSLANDSRPVPNNACTESLTDSQSDSGERMLAVDSEMRKSDSWASALIAELDQFKNSSASSRDVKNPVDIDLMDDFLEMEKLAALSEVERVSSSFEAETDSDQAVAIDKALKVETETLKSQVTDSEEKVEKLEAEKKELEMALAEARIQLDTSCNALMAANDKLAELQMQFNLANESKIAALGQADLLDAERESLALQLDSKSTEVEKLQAAVALLEESADRKELELQLESTSVEVANLRKTVASFQEQIDAERTLSVQHKAYADMAEADKESLELQLQSAHADIGKLRGSMETLQSELQKEKAMYEELVVQIGAMKIESEKTLGVESAKESLEAQLLVVNSEITKLQGTLSNLECDAAKEKAYSSELKMQLEAVEGIRKMLESELESSHQETMKLKEKISSLEVRLRDQTALLVEFTAKAEDAVAARKSMEGQLEGAKLEITKLTNRMSLLHGKIEEEKLLSEEYEAKCRRLEAQLSRDSREAKLWRLANTNGDLKVKQDKDLSSAAGKLAECQKTIANLGRQLKSLTDLDCVATEPEKLESGDALLDFRDHDVEVPPANTANGLYDLDLPRSNGSCLSPIPQMQSSPIPQMQSSSPPLGTSVFSGGLSSLGSYRSKTRKCHLMLFNSMGFFGSAAKVYKPVSEVNLGADSNEFYISPNVKAPRVAGLLVKIFAWILETPIIGPIVLYFLKRDNLVNRLVSDADIPEPPMFTTAHTCQDIPEQNVNLTKPDLSPAERVQEAVICLPAHLESTIADPSSPGFRRWTIRDFTNAYSSGEITPVMVARRFLAAVKECSGPDLKMALFISCNPEDIIRQAEESTLRYQQGATLSAMDGVLVAVKDEIDCLPYATTGGTRWLQRMRPCVQDAAVVSQLRACGAVLAGKTNMHELGAGTSGINPHHGSTRNPYNTSKVAGGSSGGSAAVVCAGLCPVALGADGGGSVRMPAALCGVVGLKPTAGRLSKDGLLPLNWTVGVPGILAATVEDALVVYAAIVDQSGPTHLQPELNIPLLNATSSMPTIRLAKYAKTVDVTIPEIEEMRLAHYVTMGSECTASFANYLDKLSKSEIGWDVRIALSAYGSFSNRAYLNSQRIRNRQMYFHDKIFKTFDAIVTPMTGVTAYDLQDDALHTGELDYINGAALVRYSISGNFLGLPAITVRVGYDREGLPVGLQFIGRPWSEATLLHLAYAMQEACSKSYRKPMVYYDLLKKNKY
uniref:Amidase domain-containing protein n=1 Tax=Leersia perrieri TaxID=77586 RepID=A0A0D9XPI1_9ORYZ